jgi:hypothetical protein
MKNPSLLLVAAAALLVLVLPVSAATPGFGNLYFNGSIVRTVVPPAAFPNQGIDNFYKVTNGVQNQLGIASVAPGSPDYHGGHWKVFLVSFNTGKAPSLLTSESAVLSAQNAGSVTVVRSASADFLCPVQP